MKFTRKDRVSIGNWFIGSYYANIQLIRFRVNELLLYMLQVYNYKLLNRCLLILFKTWLYLSISYNLKCDYPHHAMIKHQAMCQWESKASTVV